MFISTLKAVLMISVNLQSLKFINLISKISVSESFTREQEKLQAFLIKFELYIEFNTNKFTHKMNKNLFITFYLKNVVFDWINFQLHEFLDKSSQKKKRDDILIYSDFQKFKEDLWQIFRIINEKQTTKQQLYILQQTESAVIYAAEFQCIAVFTEWDNKVLTSQYYWELQETIKNEIVQRDQSEKLQKMINVLININSHQWK